MDPVSWEREVSQESSFWQIPPWHLHQELLQELLVELLLAFWLVWLAWVDPQWTEASVRGLPEEPWLLELV